MDAKNAIAGILRDATGKRASGRELLVSEKKSILLPEAAATLKEQWKGAGRDNAHVVMMLSEEDGSNIHLVTGWDGRDTFVCMTEEGLCYVNQRKLEKLKVHESWDPKIRLIDIRAHQLTEAEADGLTHHDVKVLVDRIKKTLTKSSKKRRKSRLRNMEKFFSVLAVEDTNSEKATKSGPDSETEMDKVDEKDDRIPDAPKEPSTTKLPKTAKDDQHHRESVNWDVTDKFGRVRRRGLSHPMMQENSTDPQMDKRELVDMDSEGKGSSPGATPGGNKTDPQQQLRQLVRMNRESKKFLEGLRENHTDPQLDKREHVPIRREGGKWNQVSPTPGGNKTDREMNKRERVRMDRETSGGTVRSEEKAIGAKDSSDKSDEDGHMTYAGEKVKNPEMSARPKITVRHEALGDDKAKKLFGPGASRKSPEKAKKPLLMLVLMGKKKPMAEGTEYCPNCRTSYTVKGGSPFGPMRGLRRKAEGRPGEVCPKCAAKREKTGGGLKMRFQMGGKKPQPSFESRFSRTQLNLVKTEAQTPSVLANIDRMRAAARKRQGSY